jgi:hypothetical protein
MVLDRIGNLPMLASVKSPNKLQWARALIASIPPAELPYLLAVTEDKRAGLVGVQPNKYGGKRMLNEILTEVLKEHFTKKKTKAPRKKP